MSGWYQRGQRGFPASSAPWLKRDFSCAFQDAWIGRAPMLGRIDVRFHTQANALLRGESFMTAAEPQTTGAHAAQSPHDGNDD